MRGEAPFYSEDFTNPFSFGYVDAKAVYDGDNLHFPVCASIFNIYMVSLPFILC